MPKPTEFRIANVEIGSTDNVNIAYSRHTANLATVGLVEADCTQLAGYLLRRIRRTLPHFNPECLVVTLFACDRQEAEILEQDRNPLPRIKSCAELEEEGQERYNQALAKYRNGDIDIIELRKAA